MEDDTRDPKILERQLGAVEREGTSSLEHLLAFQLTNDSEVLDWKRC